MKTRAIEGNTARMFANCFGKFPLVSNHSNKAFALVRSFSGIILSPFDTKRDQLMTRFLCVFTNFQTPSILFLRLSSGVSRDFQFYICILFLQDSRGFPTLPVPLILQNFQFLNSTFLASSFSFLVCPAFLFQF